MRWINRVSFSLRSLLRGGAVKNDIDEEVKLHIERQIEENIGAGMSPEQARRDALVAFGGIENIREQCWDARTVKWIEDLLQDLGYGARLLKKNPSYTAVAVLTLAVGIGANATIFGFADLLLRRPVELKSLDRLVAISEQKAGDADPEGVAPENFMDLRETSTTLEYLSAYQYWSPTLTGQGLPVEIRGNRVTADFFQTVGATPSQGRGFLEDEESPGQNFSIILSDAFWRRVFHADPAILGKNLELDGSAYVVVGIMPPAFKFPLGAQFWTPLALQKGGTSRGGNDLSVIGNIRTGVPADRVRLELDTIWTRLQRQYPTENNSQRLTVIALRDWIVDQDSRQFVWFLVGVVGFVLLIVCANVANLQFARAAGRQREIAVRTSLGASRFRLLRQFLTESVLLATVGALFGLLLAAWGLGVMRATLPSQVREICDVDGLKLNSAALFFTLGLAALTGVLSGIAPAWKSTSTDPNLALKESGGRSGSGRGHRLRNLFVISEVALALILLTGAALMIKGFVKLAIPNTNIGAEKLLTFHVSLPETRYSGARQLTDFYVRAVDRISVIPGIHSAAAISGLPYSFYEDETSFHVEGEPTPADGQLPIAMQEAVSLEYFKTMGIPVLEGRAFESRDSESALPVAVVSDSMVKRIWNNSNPIGKRLRMASTESHDWVTVIGVVGNTRHEVYDRGFRSILYRPLPQAPPRSADFVLRSSDDPPSLVSAVRIEIGRLDKDLAFEQVETMAAKIQRQASALRFVSFLMGIFGIIALVLCAMGVYGIVANSVTERQREIGIRMALGAQPFQVFRIIGGKGMRLVLVGLCVGLVASLALARLLANLLYGVAAWDPSTFTEIPGLLILMSLVAVYVPTRRAVGTDPVAALRQD